MRNLLLALTAFGLATPAAAQTKPAPPAAQAQPSAALQSRATELVAILGGTGDYEAFFAPAFRAQITKPQVDAIAQQLKAALGPVTAVEKIEAATAYSGTVTIGFRDGVARVGMVIDEAAPNQVNTLRILGAGPRVASIAELEAAFKALPGISGFVFARLGDGAPRILAGYQPDKPLAVGSAFKLVILAELIRSINAGERRWIDTVRIDGSPLPGGSYTMVPKNSDVPIRELALKMIAVSDNSATDILLRTLGREKVEAMLPKLGVAPDPRNLPYLSTLEAFKLKWLDGGKLGDRYAALDDAGQRAMLAGEVAAADIAPLRKMTTPPTVPSRIDTLEWFFSPADEVRIMDWLLRNSEGEAGESVREILSANPGLALDRKAWPFIGYKGGSEPGVIHGTFLLQAADKSWYAAAASWNDTAAPVDDAKFFGLVGALIVLAPKN